MECSNTDRASTIPSSSVTVRQAGIPVARPRSVRLAAEPWT